VDDDPSLLETLGDFLSFEGYEVLCATSGEDALIKMRPFQPDLIILDVMIQKTGLDFKPASGDDAWLPVDEFLDKPIKPDLLLARVDDLLGKS
jgi:DNA-binding response OmpR family regulator